MNSFQKWADDYARAFGFIVTPVANWVRVSKGAIDQHVYSAKGRDLLMPSTYARGLVDVTI